MRVQTIDFCCNLLTGHECIVLAFDEFSLRSTKNILEALREFQVFRDWLQSFLENLEIKANLVSSRP